MEKEKLEEIVANHGRWLRGDGGKHADLNRKDLCGVNLGGANLDRASRGDVT